MDIREMHVVFRELAQQMGMQTVRAILDEDIDIVLNTVIIDKVREVLLQNVGPVPYPDKVIRQNTVITPINAIRTLYSKALIFSDDIDSESADGNANELYPWHVTIKSNGVGKDKHSVMLYTGFKVSYDDKALYDCRIIEAEDLGQTLRDFCNRPAHDAPIATVFGDSTKIDVNIYTGRNINNFTKVVSFPKPSTLQFLYIREPAKVHKDFQDEFKDVSCDLPPYLHSELIERAVQKYLISVGATSGREQQRQDNQ